MNQLPPIPPSNARMPQPFVPSQWYADNTLYQILVVDYDKNVDLKDPRKILNTKLITKTRSEFNGYKLDLQTQKYLEGYPKAKPTSNNSGNTEDISSALSSYLPSPGVVFKKDFIKALSLVDSNQKIDEFSLNNFYDPMRTLLHTRKISQLIAKTWDAYLGATEDIKRNFREGQWTEIDSDVLDGLIAREIFLFSNQSDVDTLDPDNLNNYYPLKAGGKPQEQAKFLISPASRGWQGISLNLLMAGQVYRKTTTENKEYYHQISQPILSTGEIVTKYNLEVSWEKFDGDIKELKLSLDKLSSTYQVTIPYPPIPSETNLSREEIKKWANASDEDGDFPFYVKENGEYLLDVGYHSPPYPYIPLSCC
jgi:hypothetical protein